MKKLWDLLEGKKTFIGAAVVFVAGGLKALNSIDESTFAVLAALGGAISVFGLRSALNNLRKK